MKKTQNLIPTILIAFFIFISNTCIAQQGIPLPDISGTTTTGKKVDAAYFKGHVTLVSFFYIGCMPCMKEIPVLNRLQERMAKQKDFQILAIAPHSPTQLKLFNPNDTTGHSDQLARLHTETINYDILPECPDDSRGGTFPLCYTLSHKLGVSAYPTAFIINRKGEIIMTKEGFPVRDNPEETVEEMVKEMEGYLKN